MNLAQAGRAALAAGCSLIPIDGTTKKPPYDLLPQVCSIPRIYKDGQYLDSRGAPLREGAIDRGKGSWAHFQYNRPGDEEVQQWVRAGAQLAIVGGAVSDGVECIDFDIIDSTGACLHDEWREAVGELANGLIVQQTGGGGYQYIFRSTACEENQKLAYLPDPSARSGESIAIETRGEHGYFIIAPSRHPSGALYELLAGDWSEIPTITPIRRTLLLAAARALCQSKKQQKQEPNQEQVARAAPRKQTTYSASLNGQASVIGTYNNAHTVTEALERAGYQWRGRRLYLPSGGDERRPGVVILDDQSYHHDSDDPLSDGYSHSAFDVYCHFQHAGDLTAAIKAAAEELGIPYAPHGSPIFNEDGWACCPDHGTILRQGKKSGWYCPHPDQSQPRGFCVFWWRGDGYTPPADTPPTDTPSTTPSADETEAGAAERKPITLPSERILRALSDLGYTFRLNLMDDSVEVNGMRMTDVLRAQIRTEMRDRDIRPLAAVEDTYLTEAGRHAYHPIKAYLDGLVWDGTPRIGTLAGYMTCPDPLISYPDGQELTTVNVYLGRWMIGAVAKVYCQGQNLMLVFVGPQGTGKSSFARWLCSGLEAYHLEAPIVVGDKDTDIRLLTKWIWEVSELDATTRKADVAALKDFITRREVTVRKAYGHHDITKPAVASLFGTVNDGDGFLADPTGNRRFLVASVTAIDWNYRSLDVNQIWAEAVHLYHQGANWRLSPHELQTQQVLNRAYEVGDPLEGWLEKHFWLGCEDTVGMTTSDIIDHLRMRDVPVNADRSWETRIGGVLRRRGFVKRQVQGDDGRRARRFFGIQPKYTTDMQ